MVPNARKAPTQAGPITRSAYSAEPSRRAAPERRTARQGRPSGRAPGTAIGGCRACAAVGRAPGRGKAPSGVPQNAERPAGAIPPRAPPGARGARGARGTRMHIEKRPPRARRPALPQPRAAVLSAKAGLTAGFGMGPGDPRLCGRARGGRSPAAQMYSSLPGPLLRGDPGGRMAGTEEEDRASRSVLLIEDAKSSGY